jgi:hypothetical protein
VTIKHKDGKVMVWTALSRNGTGPIKESEDIMDSAMYRDILAHNLEDAADGLPLSVRKNCEFQHDNDPKHTSGLVKSWLMFNNIRTMEWPAQSPDLNPIENLWNRVKWDIQKHKPVTLGGLYPTIRKSQLGGHYATDLPEARGQHASPLRCCYQGEGLSNKVLRRL